MEEALWKKLAKKYVNNVKGGEELDGAGIYCILLNDCVVYVGQSRSLRWRIASHVSAIHDEENPEYNKAKYKLLREANEKGYEIKFRVLFFIPEEDLPLMNVIEAWEIDKYQPPLNIIHPPINGQNQYQNRKVYTMTLPQLLSLLEQQEE